MSFTQDTRLVYYLRLASPYSKAKYTILCLLFQPKLQEELNNIQQEK